ncbi:hypothetical protein BD779DRAFT_252120 [Infundibulicybe gibba]|nr:hypothetical protein BD779DRAFT_252120 [Infundibulicybe gibba]
MRALSSILEPPPPKSSPATKATAHGSPAATTSEAAQPANGSEPRGDSSPPPRIPIVRLDTDVVVDEMAASLAVSFLGHVLFLKNRYPFLYPNSPASQEKTYVHPILHFISDPTRRLVQHARGKASHRTALLIRHTVFTLLHHIHRDLHCLCAMCPEHPRFELPCILGDVRGPNVGMAKARVIYAVDGLETKIWGQRGDKGNKPNDSVEEEEEEDAEKPEDSDEEADDSEDEEDGEEGGGEEQDEEDEEDSEDEDELPPPSRSPSPPPPYISHAEQQHAIHLAERLLARTLGGADPAAISLSEIPPTHTHILLRAPRRFAHPAWAPRHNACATLEAALTEFLSDSGASPRVDDAHRKRKGRAGGGRVGHLQARSCWRFRSHDPMGDDGNVDDDGEMIWWAWEGKIAGFADW